MTKSTEDSVNQQNDSLDREAFIASENRIIRQWAMKGTLQDADAGKITIHEARLYSCKCGFFTAGPGAIFDHAQGCVA